MSFYDVKASSTASPAAVFALVSDPATWPSWQLISKVRPEGGAWIIGGVPRTVVEIRETVPDRSLTYVETSETLWRGYRSTIDLTPAADGGTDIRWHATFRSRPPLLDRFWARTLDRQMQSCADMLARRAAEDVL
jgi:uncharacterized protein YndB with AHSA1/START domain